MKSGLKIFLVLLMLLIFQGCNKPSNNNLANNILSTTELHKLVDPSNLRGKVTIVDFWATWCPPCRRQIPVLVKLQSKYGSRGFQVIGISVDKAGFRVKDPKQAVATMAKKFNVNYPVGIADDKLVKKFPPFTAIPTAFVFNQHGKNIKTLTGLHQESDLEKIITELL